MYFVILYLMFIIGIIIASFCGLMPAPVQEIIPYYFRFLAFMIGSLLCFMGIVFLYIRAKKTGANHLIEPGRPGIVNWLYVYKDGECRFTPGIRAGEGQLYNRDLDAQIPDVKTYSLCDHKIRIVPEVVGHAVDLDYILYADLLQTQYGFENLREAREGKVNKILSKIAIKRTKEIIPNENMVIGEKDESIGKKIIKKQGNTTPKSS